MSQRYMVRTGEYYFDGGLAELVAVNIIGWAITVLTAGICYPWAITMIYSWEARHTVLDGRRLRFTGTAMGLFGQWIKWFILTIITLGIYSFWVNIALKKWKTQHLVFED